MHHFYSGFPSSIINEINRFRDIRLFLTVEDCRLKMDGITLDTRTETRTLGGTEGNRDFDGLAWVLAFWGKSIRSDGQEHAQTVWRNGTDRIPLNGQTDWGGRFGGGGF